VKSTANPEVLPIEVFDGLRSSLTKDRSQFYRDFALPFYGANRPGANVSQGTLDQFWLWSMQGGLKNIYDCVKAFSETDFSEDLKKFDVPTLIMHGEDDQIVPINGTARKSCVKKTLWHDGRDQTLFVTPACRRASAKYGKPPMRGRIAAARCIASVRLSIALLI
jgi:pimeloyl-ACP methyl ester carboxylesterase